MDYFVKTNNIPQFVLFRSNDSISYYENILASMLSTTALETVIAHELAHYILGHHKIDQSTLSYDEQLSMEAQADEIATEIIMNDASTTTDQKDRLLPSDKEARIAGISYGLMILDILNIRKSALVDERIPVFNRERYVLTQLDRNYVLSEQPMYVTMSGAFRLVTSTAMLNDKFDEKATILHQFYIASKQKHHKDMFKIVSENQSFFSTQLENQIQIAVYTSGTPINNIEAKWAYPDVLYMNDLLALSIEMDNIIESITGKTRKPEIIEAISITAKNLEKKSEFYDSVNVPSLKKEYSDKADDVRKLLTN